MARRGVRGSTGISKTWRSSKSGFLFFLLLQMSLLSEVWTQNITTATTATAATETAATETVTPTSVTAGTSTSISSSTSISTSISSSSSSSASVSNTATTHSSVTDTSSSSHSPHSSSAVSSVSPASDATVSPTTHASVSTAVSTLMTSLSAVSVNGSSGNRSTGNESMVSCPAFTCSSDCNSQLLNVTAKACSANASYCEVMKQDTGYSVGCSASCVSSCGNTSLSNCTVKCCDTFNCLNSTLSALSSSYTTAATTKSTSTTTTTSTAPATAPNNGKLCQNIVCSGALCYKTGGSQMMCPIGQDYCMLKKTASTPSESWQAGCSGDCRAMASCSGSAVPCLLECCNATTAKVCLKLTGELNMPSSASRGLHCPALMLTATLLLWILRLST